ncbi:1-acyl-sn-glycerol-3-phosphate acyltransferase [Metallumcola ferriviriculae]|uniref:1-acyl-sn-glycerol-3-phosphate acyltransferase n=1 Tax=Metallumcola ferriviriculae TaxID=3039180 RepID=A0AAU0URV1_9FIRM|nr:1-acyl-sn-glycerol-3-phosphate acyltransferase [Desulfitibacteraceae bacterium MK1]
MFYSFIKGLFLIFFKIWYRWQVTGEENIPQEGPLVVVANHVSMWDPIIVGIALPRKIHFMAKEELFRIPVIGSLIPHLGAFPVKRGRSDRAALKAGMEILAAEKMLGLFPEGRRSPDGQLMEFQAGAGLMAVKGNASIVPLAISGSQGLKLQFKRRISVTIGKPVQLSEIAEKKRIGSKELTGLMEDLRRQIAQMLEKTDK